MDAQLVEVGAATLAAAGVTTLSVGLAKLSRWRGLARRFETFVVADAEARPLRRREAEARPQSSFVTSLQRRLSASSLGTVVQRRIVRAGLALRPADFILIQAGAALVCAVLGLLLFASAGPLRLVWAAAFALAGFGTPLWVLGVLGTRRLNAFERQLPGAVDSMAGTLQAGSALPQAMEGIARDMLPPISIEFRRVTRELELGLSLNDALANLLDRLPSADLLMLNSAIAIQNRVGGDLAGILKGLSHTIRERLRIRSEINVLTAQGRMSAYVITALPTMLFILLYFMRREFIMQLFLPGITRLLFAGGIGGLFIGYFSMKKIVAIDV